MCTIRWVDILKPFGVIQIAKDVFLTFSSGKLFVAQGDDTGKVQMINLHLPLSQLLPVLSSPQPWLSTAAFG